MMRDIFLGKPSHWGLWVVIIAALTAMGMEYMHVRWFSTFILLLLALSAAVIGFIVITYRKGEVITREPFDDAAGGGGPRAVADE